ncbi:MAG TPA: hypothetical protein VLZ30_03635 [Verrucomicrobiae bacterium]|nr:hypothetical protein [Verrucomicrobiae bacterium]
MTPKTKAWLLRLALLAIATVVSFALLEFAVRRLFPFFNPQGPQQIVFHVNKDGVPLGPENLTVRQRSPQGDYDVQVTFNRFGFRDSKDLSSATSTDWFAVGDSMGLGWGNPVTNRYSDVLERLAKIKVYNICVPTDIAGYNLLARYAEQQSGIHISNLVVSITMENDLRDYYRSSPTAEPPSKRSVKESLRAFVKRHSAVYLLLATELQQTEAMHRFFQAIGVARMEASDELMYKNKFFVPAMQYSVKLLDQLTSGRQRAVVLIIPSRALWIGENREVESKVHDYFVSEIRKNPHLEVIDMRPVFEATGNPMQFYFKHDGHWNAKGHRWGGEYLASQILTGKLPPAPNALSAPGK